MIGALLLRGRSIVKKFLGRMIIVLGCAVIGGSAIWSFVQARSEAKHDDDDAEKPPKMASRVSNADGVPTITLDNDALTRSEITTLPLKNAMHVQMLRAYGTVLDLQGLTDLVNKYATAKAGIETQQAKRDLALANFKRAKALYGEGPRAVSQAQLEAAEENVRIDAASLAAATAQLETLARTALQTWGNVLGDGLQHSSPLITALVERRDVLIQVTLPPDEPIGKNPVDAFVRPAGGGRIPLHFVSPAATTDPHIQGQSFFYTAAAESGLVPGMNVVAYLPSGKAVARVEVPASAIVWLQGRAWAYFRTGPTTLVRREIETDAPAPGGGYFVKGLPDGTRVVTRGAQMLLSEEFRSQIQEEE